MDPLTHALAGAAVAYSVGGAKFGRRAMVVGAVAGLLPDLDVLIRSASDPLLAIEHHRGFTHSFAFVPIGGFLAALLAGKWRAWPAAMLAYLTHPLLDAATTYGTQLFWPLLDTRVGLDIISIVDPIFTLILLIACIAPKRVRHAALIMAVLWLALGYTQRERASAAQMRLAKQRGDRVERAAVFPTFGNNLVWRSLYKTNGVLRMDRIRVFGSATYAEGPAVEEEKPAPGETPILDYQRFLWFTDGWLARDPEDPWIIGDARYSLYADRYKPVWGIRFAPRTQWVDRSRERRVSLRDTWKEIAGADAHFRPLP